MSLSDDFHRDMVDTYVRAKRECEYNASLFMKMVSEMGGLQTAKTLLAKPGVSDGFAALWERKRLDLAVESRVLGPKYRSLFTLAERRIAWERLKEYGVVLPEPVDEVELSDVTAPPAVTGRAAKGSRRHLQDLINRQPEYLNCLLLSSSPSLRAYAAGHPEWVSPLESDGYREYQDDKFLEVLGLSKHAGQLADFWPQGGPVWDALGLVPLGSGGRGVLLVEAKAHVGELEGPGCRASDASRAKISRSVDVVKRMLGVDPGADWLGEHYQHANRLAHLYFLNVVAQVPAWFVSLCFVGDAEMNGPRAVVGWAPAWSAVEGRLGILGQHLLRSRVVTAYLPMLWNIGS